MWRWSPQVPERHLEAIVCPATELHITILVIKGEPGDINGTGRHEDARRNVGAETLVGNHHVGWVGRVKSFAGTKIIDHCIQSDSW